MTLLTPLGLIGLLGVVALIIIYIIKPNYQQKFISSTHIWKLSLKYKKKKIPTSKLRQLLLILCQILFLTTCAFILAQPNKILRSLIQEPEVILIIDSSASMRTQDSTGISRYERAVEEVATLAQDTFMANGYVSIILADDTPEFLLQQRLTKGYIFELPNYLNALLQDDTQCTYSTADINGAVALCESIMLENPNAKIHLYTDNEYSMSEEMSKMVVLEKMSDADEMNLAVLDATTQRIENKFNFFIDVAGYGAKVNSTPFDVVLEIEGANAVDSSEIGEKIQLVQTVSCVNGETTPVLFLNKDLYDANQDVYDSYATYIYTIPEGKGIATYKSLKVFLRDTQSELVIEDSLMEDNEFYLYDGMKPVIKIQYASAEPNSFWPAAIRELRNIVADRWEIQFVSVKKDEPVATDGFDLYIFEHAVPETLPEDGVLWLMSPAEIYTSGTGIVVGQNMETTNSSGNALESESFHPILNNIDADDITVSAFKELILDDSYEPLLFMDDFPMLAVRNDEDMKVVITAFNLHFSNLAIKVEFPMLVYNMFSHFFPNTVNGNAFNVGEAVELNAMATSLQVFGEDFDETFDTFPASFVVSKPGKYTLKQTNFAGREFREEIYVRMPKEESNIFKSGETLNTLYIPYDMQEFFEDFLLYLAILLVSVAFIEWWLRHHEGV